MVAQIGELLNHQSILQTANILNERSVPSGTGRQFRKDSCSSAARLLFEAEL
ncbi:hypothetical protein PAMC26510_05720 [Caballeronia sordidicola]|uniref:Uncharacterized protein n=1 Tax=Caballeronia sordidicola TaxID=196367 RepID=A0A242N7E0_CABSO|nr:hypothetical protein PAMC26510_05720 [Caballeronia sordidicola]